MLVKIYTTHLIGVQTQSFERAKRTFYEKGSCAYNLTRKKKLFVFKQYGPV